MMLAAGALMASCSDDETVGQKHREVTYKIAAFAPRNMQDELKETAGWAQDILQRAQEQMPLNVKLSLEWMEETADSMDMYLDRIEASDYMAIIGPSDADMAKTLLGSTAIGKRTVLMPTLGSAEVQRIYAASDNVFFLTQSDVMQSEILLSVLNNSGATTKNFAMVTSNDSYGETFREWFGFQAAEMDCDVTTVELLDENLGVEQVVENYRIRHRDAAVNGSDTDSQGYTFFFPSSSDELLTLDRKLTEMDETEWDDEDESIYWAANTICSDRCVDYSVASQVKHTFVGVEPTSLPESGFSTSYKNRYGKYPINGMAQMFDAMYMLTYAINVMDAEGVTAPGRLSEYIVRLLDGREYFNMGWTASDVHQTLSVLRSGGKPDLRGVSSNWDFDERFHSSPLATTYRLWQLHNGSYGTVAYISANGSRHSISNFDLWSTEKPKILDIVDSYNGPDLTYPELKDMYAVVVAASTGWNNYRHQADALAMYHLLKRHGYDDDHIILIMEDDIANNPKNKNSGEIRVNIGGENLYHDLKIDYKLTDLTYDDIIDIVSGHKSDRLPVVLPSTANDNVLFFWSGHGNPNTLYVDDTKFPAKGVHRMLSTMNDEHKYRRLFFVIEACYSGSVADECIGVPGVLMMTAANASETSKADVLDSSLPAYLSNGFTRGFQQRIDAEPNVTLRDLYYHVAGQTVGSHARIYNVDYFGSVYKTRMDEFMRYASN